MNKLCFSKYVNTAVFFLLFLGLCKAVVAQDTLNCSFKSINKSKTAEWLQKVDDWGSRRTASPNHLACINWIATEFEALGLKVCRDLHTFSCFYQSDDNLHLSILKNKQQQNVTIAAAYPFSGLTNHEGITAPMVFIAGKKYKKAKGKIVVVEVSNKAIPTDILFDIHSELPAGSKVLSEEIINPVLSSTLFGPDLVAFKKAGALAVIAVWKNMSEGMAGGQYLPFTFPYRSIPAVWLAGNDGYQLMNAAKNNEIAKLILEGTLDTNAQAASLWTVVEGENGNETILIITHTDGTNPAEENGFVGLLAMAKRLVESGKKPERTVAFVAVAGHLRLPDITYRKKQQATTIWLKEHPELWDGKKGHRKAVAGIVLEHLGAMEWADGLGGYGPTGNPDIEITYATTAVMREIVEKSWKSRTVPYRAAVVTPRSIIHFGEGEPLFEAGIPEISILGIPTYLLNEMKKQGPGINIQQVSELVNKDLVLDQCTVASDVLEELLKLPSNSFGKIKHVGFFGKLKDIFKAVKVIITKE